MNRWHASYFHRQFNALLACKFENKKFSCKLRWIFLFYFFICTFVRNLSSKCIFELSHAISPRPCGPSPLLLLLNRKYSALKILPITFILKETWKFVISENNWGICRPSNVYRFSTWLLQGLQINLYIINFNFPTFIFRFSLHLKN